MPRPRKRSGPNKSGNRTSVSWRRWLLLGCLALLSGFLLYLIYLDQVVQLRFDGRRWSVPAQVFGRPLVLYPGAELEESRLLHELRGLGYRRVDHPDSEGSFSNYRGRFLIRTRPFLFPQGDQSSGYLELKLEEGRLVSLKQAASGKPLEHYLLEPRLVGSLHPAHSEDRVLLRREELPEGLVQALIAVEDRHFYDHLGVDPLAIARAAWANLRAVGLVQGGSTLTQQLVKNFFLTPERSLWRKFNEVLMALILEARYEKDEILEAYANEIYLGQDGGRAIHGFGLASRFYFNRPLKELDLPRTALLVTLVRGPSAYDPRRHPERAKKRRQLVLGIMREQGLISAELAQQAAAAPLGVQQGEVRASGSPAFMDLVRRQLRRDYKEADLAGEGLRIFSTLDPWLQSQAEQSLTKQLGRIEKARGMAAGTLQGAMVLADVETAEVTALVGDRKADYAGFNRALDAVRPVGSLIKPAVYLAALEQPRRYHLLSKLEDRPISLKESNGQIWSPSNYDHQSHGPVSLRSALANSYNQATVRLGLEVGLDRVVENLTALGIQRPMIPYPSMLLGAVSLSPLEMAQVYQTLAAGGLRSTMKAIHAVTDSKGRLLSRYPLSLTRAFDEKAVYLLNQALQETVRSGTAQSLTTLLRQADGIAGKTGTTDDLRDSWFAGFDRRHVAVAWVGRDDNEPTGLTGASGAMRVWGELMERIGVAAISANPPLGVELVEIDSASGLLGKGCDASERIPFIRGSGPRESAACARKSRSMLDDGIRWFQQLMESN